MTKRNCPICGKPAAVKYRPFCSHRCSDVDLGRWFNESYRVPGEAAPQSRNGTHNGTGETVEEE